MEPQENTETRNLEASATPREATGDLLQRLAALTPPSDVEARDSEPLPERPGL